MKTIKQYNNITIRLLVGAVALYQKTLSPDHGWLSARYPGGYCKYHPDCSEYCKQAINHRGVIKGVGLGIWRMLRCNPWSAGGIDKVK